MNIIITSNMLSMKIWWKPCSSNIDMDTVDIVVVLIFGGGIRNPGLWDKLEFPFSSSWHVRAGQLFELFFSFQQLMLRI